MRWLALPAAWWSILAFGWALPVPEWLGRPGLWSALGAVALFGAAQRHSRAVALLLAVVLAAMLATADVLHRVAGLAGLLGVAGLLLGTGLVALVVDERRDGRALAFQRLGEILRDDPLALASVLLRRLGVSP